MHVSRNGSRRLAIWVVWAGSLVLGSLLWTGCPDNQAPPCKEATDCTGGLRCLAGKCVPGSEAGVEVTTEQAGEGAPAERTTPPDGAPLPEPPPFDAGWSDGLLPPPESLQEGTTPGGPGTRKLGDTCNPGITALAQDKCEKDLLCAAPDLAPVGICQKVCDPKASACGAGEACGPVRAIETAALQGHACGPASKPGYACTDGLPCEAGNSCIRYTEPNRGICQKTCTKRDDCPGWCASGKGLSGDASGCVRLVKNIGESCDKDATCDSGLACEGSGDDRVCLKQTCSAQAPCATGNVCTPILDDKGQPRYTVCFPIVPRFGRCHSANRCDKDLLCASFTGDNPLAACVTDCTTDPKVCATDEACISVSNTKQGCVKVIPEGGLCEGPAQCDKDLVCAATQVDGPRFCVKDCTKDASVCQTPAACVALDGLQQSVCAQACDPKAPVCTNTAFACVAAGSAGACLPVAPLAPGEVKVGGVCRRSAAAAPNARCAPTLTCMPLAEGERCLQLCDPKSPLCPTGQSCLLDQQTARYVCGSAEKAGQPCDLSASQLCEAGQVCAHKGFSSAGTCVAAPTRKLGDSCANTALPCSSGLLCAGDPTVPFRWTCREPCDPSAPSGACPTKEACVSLVKGAACFATCSSPQDTCPQKTHTCQTLQGKQICM